MGFQVSTHTEDSGWNKEKKFKLLCKFRLQFE